MKVSPVILALLFCCPCCSFSQFSASGAGKDTVTTELLVLDSLNGQPLSYASVRLFREPAHALVTGSITNGKGIARIKFKFAEPGPGLSAEVTVTGYKPYLLPLTTPFFQRYTVLLAAAPDTLGNVTVRSSIASVKREIDKLVFKIDPALYPRNAALADIMNKVPSLTIDGEGNVMIKGRIMSDIYLDGKLVSKELLKALPLTVIDRVEIIDNPSAAFNTGNGIVNIITRKTPAAAVYGRLSMKTGLLRTAFTPFGNSMLKGKKTLFNLTVSHQYRRQPKQTSLERIETAAQTLNLKQTAASKEKIGFSYISSDFFHDIDSLTRIASSLYLNNVNVNAASTAVNSFRSITFNSSHQYRFKANNLVADLDLRRLLPGKAALSFTNRIFSGSNPVEIDNLFAGNGLQQQASFFTSAEKSNSFSSQLLYTKTAAAKKADLEAGISFTSLQSVSPFTNYEKDTLTGNIITVNANSDISDFSKKILTPFVSLRFKIKNYGFRAGLRNEWSRIGFSYRSGRLPVPLLQNSIPLPNLLIQRSAGKNTNLTAQYKKSVKRPDIGMLSQFLNSDAFGIASTGNSFLKPETLHNFSFSLDQTSSRSSLVYFGNFTAYMTLLRNPIFEGQFTPNDTTIIRKFVNLRRQTLTGVSVSQFFQFADKGSLNITGFAENYLTPAGAQPGLAYHSAFLLWGCTVSAEIQTKKAGSFGADLTYKNRLYDFQYTITRYPLVVLSYRKTFFKNKWSLLASWFDVFNRSANSNSYFFNNVFRINNTTTVKANNLFVTLTYTLGKRIRNTYTKNSIQVDETKEKKSKTD